MDDLKPCPLCGALPCDWVDDPHKAEVGLCWTLAKIREVLGVGEKPMLGELPDILATKLEAQAAEIARLKEAFQGAIIAEVVDRGNWSLSLLYGKGDEACLRARDASDLIRALTGSQSHD